MNIYIVQLMYSDNYDHFIIYLNEKKYNHLDTLYAIYKLSLIGL